MRRAGCACLTFAYPRPTTVSTATSACVRCPCAANTHVLRAAAPCPWTTQTCKRVTPAVRRMCRHTRALPTPCLPADSCGLAITRPCSHAHKPTPPCIGLTNTTANRHADATSGGLRSAESPPVMRQQVRPGGSALPPGSAVLEQGHHHRDGRQGYHEVQHHGAELRQHVMCLRSQNQVRGVGGVVQQE